MVARGFGARSDALEGKGREARGGHRAAEAVGVMFFGGRDHASSSMFFGEHRAAGSCFSGSIVHPAAGSCFSGSIVHRATGSCFSGKMGVSFFRGGAPFASHRKRGFRQVQVFGGGFGTSCFLPVPRIAERSISTRSATLKGREARGRYRATEDVGGYLSVRGMEFLYTFFCDSIADPWPGMLRCGGFCTPAVQQCINSS